MECILDKITVHYEVFGEGRPVFILPGWTLNARWAAHATEPYFQQREGWKRFYLDPPGHGKTPGADWITGQDQILEVLLACIDRLAMGQRFSLIGISLGAYLARGIRLYRADRIDGIAMIVPVIIAQDANRSVPPYQVLVEDPALQADLSPAEADFYEIAVVRSRKWLDYERAFPPTPEDETGDAEFLNRIRERPETYAFSFDVDQVPEPFPGPSLIITGRQDAVVGYHDAWNLLEKYPRATYAVLDRAGHLMEEKAGLVSALVNDWLTRVEHQPAG